MCWVELKSSRTFFCSSRPQDSFRWWAIGKRQPVCLFFQTHGGAPFVEVLVHFKFYLDISPKHVMPLFFSPPSSRMDDSDSCSDVPEYFFVFCKCFPLCRSCIQGRSNAESVSRNHPQNSSPPDSTSASGDPWSRDVICLPPVTGVPRENVRHPHVDPGQLQVCMNASYRKWWTAQILIELQS